MNDCSIRKNYTVLLNNFSTTQSLNQKNKIKSIRKNGESFLKLNKLNLKILTYL